MPGVTQTLRSEISERAADNTINYELFTGNLSSWQSRGCKCPNMTVQDAKSRDRHSEYLRPPTSSIFRYLDCLWGAVRIVSRCLVERWARPSSRLSSVEPGGLRYLRVVLLNSYNAHQYIMVQTIMRVCLSRCPILQTVRLSGGEAGSSIRGCSEHCRG